MENKTIIITLAIILFLLIMLNHIIITPVIPPKPIGGCAGTMYGCCPNLMTPKFDAQGTNCLGSKPIGGCAGTMYGCCPNQVTPKFDAQGSNCIIKQN